MARAVDVGQYVYDRKGWIDAWRLQKLVYFAHAWSLAWDGRGLFDSDVEAWPDGPVERELYAANKYGRDRWNSTKLVEADTSRLTPRQIAVIDAVIEHYGNWTRQELIDASHTPAWLATRAGAARHAQGDVIPVGDIRRWHTRAALAGKDTPKPPADHVGVVRDVSGDLVDAHIDRWRGVLDLLAER
ncbi:Protein of uncharacterised function, possible prophage protein [Mycobacteroides abscessus subsp. abscessus]|uniref:Panacea domain-containing protein n=1 Tax=Mycobacteroides abscessus TaxID=36809 RepID=UPI0009D44CEE|nr:Panacea domain-containing protein [Mycobacteroides abscessus]MBN7355556.1 SocA family protein [Mycobacteroides abscessus subsp. abscessus]MBN7360335.1 SocA family protein [Mycobacteroides abscessus subsp. abscessus]MBN7476852.1 SocA family protein [Mycobacteroides abscessus subsp. abscessus]SLI67377.1 Protein of uncharacterised function, possible prophage protein [Mycobacteroides abscessus subsp. abscessus]